MKQLSFAADDRFPNTQQKEVISDRVKQSEKSPSARSQSDYYRFFQEQIAILGQPYDVTRIPISVLQQMQFDPMLAFGLHFKLLPIMQAKWHIKCERPDIAAFVDNSLRAILGQYINQRSQALSFGFAPIVKRFQSEIPNWTYESQGEQVKVWDNGNVEAITWKPFVGLPSDPVNVEPRWDARGQFNGIKWQGGTNPLPFPVENSDDGTKEIPVEHSLWVTNEKAKATGSLWGYPLVGFAYRYWWSYWFRWALYDRFFERKADPPYLVYYPSGEGADYSQEDDNEPESMKQLALGIGDSAKGGGTVAMPGQTINGYDDRPTSIREWMIQELEVKGDMTHFVESFEYLDVMKLRSLWIPEQALMEGKGGTSSRNVASEEIGIHKEGAAQLAQEIDNELNRYVIPDLVYTNFPEFDGTVEKVTTGFTDADQKTLDSTLALLGQNDAAALRHIDVRELLNRLGMPLVSVKEIERQNEEAQKALQESVPDQVIPNDGNAGVTKQGFYIAGRPTITLSDTSEFVDKLPNSKHYEDKVILSQAKALRQRWKNEYADIYEDFADFVSRQNFSEEVDLAEESLADKLVTAWSYSRDKLSSLLSDSHSIGEKIIARAGQREFKRIVTDEDWIPDPDEVADFLAERGAIYVKAVDETIKDELRRYLSSAIADGMSQQDIVSGIREHFSDFPSWKADRLVRTEVRDGYNFATIAAGERAGVKIVQIFDALKGEEVSDPECIERNGKFFTIGQALSEVLKEHPNGTSEIRLTKRQNLSVEHVSELPDDENTLAYFDEQNGIVYIKDNIPFELELKYLDELGKILENE